jgi:hypothetical protein
MDIDDGFLHLLLPDGSTKEDVKLPGEPLGKQIQDAFDDGKELMVTIVAAMGEEAAVSFKEAVRIPLRPPFADSRLNLCSPTSPKCLTSSELLDSRASVSSDRFILLGSPCILAVR